MRDKWELVEGKDEACCLDVSSLACVGTVISSLRQVRGFGKEMVICFNFVRSLFLGDFSSFWCLFRSLGSKRPIIIEVPLVVVFEMLLVVGSSPLSFGVSHAGGVVDGFVVSPPKDVSCDNGFIFR